MPYSVSTDVGQVTTPQDLIKLTDDANTGAVDQAKVAAAIESADAEIDGYLQAAGYQVPLSPVTQRVREVSALLALYYLYVRINANPLEGRKQAFADARTWLKDVGAKKALIGSATMQPPVQTGGRPQCTHTPAGRVFDPDKMGEY
jgi:phage gp36-like protein